MDKKSSTYFIPPELRKHVQLIKELPEIVADTVTDPDTYVALNELLNPVKWIESAGQKSGKFFESGGKDIESGAEALIETLGLAAGPMAQKYASTLAPMVSRGVGSGVKSLQELVMPLGATDDVAKKVPQKEGISRRDFIAGGTALGTLAGLKQAGDLLPPTKGIKAAAKTPLASTIKALNSIKSDYKKVSNEQKLIDESIVDLKANPSKLIEDGYYYYKEHTPEDIVKLKKLEKLSDTTQMKVIKSVDSMEEKIGSLVSSLLKQSKKDLMKLNDDQLKSLRGHLTDNYYYSGFGTTKYVKFAPSDEFNIFQGPVDPKDFFKSDLADKTRMRKLSSSKEPSEKTDYEKIVLRVDEVLEERGLTTIEDVNKLKTLALRIPGEVGEYNQGGLTMEQQMSLFQEPIKAHEGTIVYNQGGSGTGLPLQPPPQNTVTGEGIKDPTTGEAIDDQPTPDISETAVEDPDPNVINTDVDVETEIAINPETGKPFTLEELLPIIDKPGIDPFTTDPKTINPDLENPFIPNPVPTTIPTKKIVDESIQVKPSVGDNYKGDRTKLFEKWNKDQYSPFGNLLGGDNKLPKGHYFGPADGVHQYGTGPYAAETQAFLDIHYGGSFNNFMEGKIIPSIGKLGLGSVKQSTIAPKNNAINDMPLYGYMNKGGMTVEQQMNLFDEGGMKDDGMNVDPVSGNEIPPGSLAKEVRDDIPAQLSEGEYVVPADVVQYYGVKFFEDLRMEAKRGLAEMEATGRIGGEPMSVTMIAVGEAEKEKKKKALGGPVGYANGGMSDDMQQIEQSRSFNPADYVTLGFTPVSPSQYTNPADQEMITRTVTYYHGETGESKVITFVGGVVAPPTDEEFTRPPWSTNKPAPTKVEKKEDRSDRDRKDPPPGWGADPQQYNFTGWDQERWDQEIDTLVKPSGLGNFGIVGGFFKTAGAANALTAIKLMEAKGLDTKLAQSKVDKLISSFNPIQKNIVNALTSDRLMGDYPSYVSKSNPSYANYKVSPTTPKGPIISTEKEKSNMDAISERNKEKGYEKDLTGSTGANISASDRKAAEKKIEGLSEKKQKTIQKAQTETQRKIQEGKATGNYKGFNKGGLINKPKRNPKKPRGKGLGSK